MKEKINKMWILTVNNFYSQECMKQSKAIFTDKESAFKSFNKLVCDYYKEEIDTAKDMFEKEISSLEDIINEATKVGNNFYMNDEYLEKGNAKIKFLDYYN